MSYKRSILIGILLISIVLLISIITFYLSRGICPSGSFACDNGTICVPQRAICDNRLDCMDKQDEQALECGNYHGSLYITNIARNFSKIRDNKFNLQKCNLKLFPKGCFCRYLTGLLCGYGNFTEVPKVSVNVTMLMLFSNYIKLQSNSFVNYTELRKLSLRNNYISTLPQSIFNNLLKLTELHLNNNRIKSIPKGIFQYLISLEWLFLDVNLIEYFYLNDLIYLQRLKWLNISNNYLTFNDDDDDDDDDNNIENGIQQFPNMKNLLELYLDHNEMEMINEYLFSELEHLHLLSVNYNRIHFIHPRGFRKLTQLRELRISNNHLLDLPEHLFQKILHLDALNIGNNLLRINDDILGNINISYLNIDGIDFDDIEFNSIQTLKYLKTIVYKKFYYCSMTPNIKRCRPNTDGVSSLEDLLTKPVLRYSTWLMATLTCLGNGLVLLGRYTYRADENRAVSIVIRNLAVADFLMGLYLIIIGVQDYRYRKRYHEIALDWMASWNCAGAGVLAMISSEVSLLILAFMSIERFLLIADPFGGHRRLNTQNVFIFLFTIWLMGTMIAIIPLIHWRSSTRFYGTYSGICFPLHLQERFPLGWQYSAFVFIGINMFLLILIATLYTALLLSIWRTRRQTPLAMLDCEFAIRFFFIVLTDASCWIPIISLKILAFLSYEISSDIYAWLVVFILPLNSAVNPLLYTFTTPKYRNQVVLRGWNKFINRKRTYKCGVGDGGGGGGILMGDGGGGCAGTNNNNNKNTNTNKYNHNNNNNNKIGNVGGCVRGVICGIGGVIDSGVGSGSGPSGGTGDRSGSGGQCTLADGLVITSNQSDESKGLPLVYNNDNNNSHDSSQLNGKNCGLNEKSSNNHNKNNHNNNRKF